VSDLAIPWVEAAILLPLIGAIWVRRLRDPREARRHSLLACGLTLVCAIGAWLEILLADDVRATHRVWDLLFEIDAMSAPLLVLAALLYLLTVLSTLGTTARRSSFPSLLAAESILLATFSSIQPWVLIALLAIGTLSPLAELMSRRRPLRVYLFHMGLFVALLVAGQLLLDLGDSRAVSLVGMTMLAVAVLVRSGIVPLHCWTTDLFEHASFGTALLFVAPMVGAYAAMRLIFGIAPEWLLHGIAIFSLITAVYSAGMAIVQREARRFFCYLFLSHSSLVFVGLAMATPLGVTAALCAWLSVGLTMGGFGLTLRALETRTGTLSLDKFHGMFASTARLAALFLLTGLASVGFPGTVGFVGAELLVDAAAQVYPLAEIAVVIASALNGLSVLHAYFRIFTGTQHLSSIDLHSRRRERLAIIIMSVLILGGGLYPQPGVASRYHVAADLVLQRERRLDAQAAPRIAKAEDSPLERD
jgi:NADH-quinone oxidoreductase subunit M